ncbi:MAG: ABC transporter permease [Candidatus Thorarchaeota archaeon]|nr:ABC transporter permease [Candidatus Thorarchaeota archaeon]
MTGGIDSRRISTMVRRIYRQIRRDRRTLGLMVVAPILVTFLFAFVFAGTITSVPTAVCIQDEPLEMIMGSTVSDLLEENENVTIFHRSYVDAFDGFGSTIQAVLVLPSDLTQALVIGENVNVQLRVNVTSELQVNYILSIVGNVTSEASIQMFGRRSIQLEKTITYAIPLPPFGGSLSFNLSLVDDDEGFSDTIGAAFEETLSQNGNVSVLPRSTRDAVIETISNEGAVAGVYIAANFTEASLTGGSSTVEIFINGIESTEATTALAAIREALSEAFTEIVGRGTETNITYVYGEAGMSMIDLVGSSMIGFLSVFFGFLISGIFFLRERQQGTLERMHASPLSDIEIVLGYVIAFIGVSFVQTALVSCVILYYSPRLLSSLLLVTPLVLLLAIGSVTLAIAASYRMKNELQVLQMIPMFIIPQMFLSGLLFPLTLLPAYLAFLPYIFPLTYFVMAVKAVVFFHATLLDVTIPLLVLLLYCILGLGLALVKPSEK